MQGVAHVVRAALAPRVGHSLADMTVRATAVSLGKSSDDLDTGDLPTLIERASQVLSGFATSAHIEAIVREINAQVNEL